MTHFMKGLLFSVPRKSTKEVFGLILKSHEVRTVKTYTLPFRDARRKELISSVIKNYVRFESTKGPDRFIPKDPFAKRSLWKSVTFVLVVGSFFTGTLIYWKIEKMKMEEAQRKKALGKAQIGGRFELIDENGKTRKSEDFLGKWLLIYFGFTHCPDICPDEMEKMANVVNKIDKLKNKRDIVPIFISVDPERDTPSVVGKYVKEFSDKFIALTGTIEQISAVCKAYRIYYSPGPKDKDSDYIVDHSIIMYLVDPEGNFMDYYGQRADADQIVESIKFNWGKYDQSHKKKLFF